MVDDPIHLIPFFLLLLYTPSSTSQYQSNNTSINVDQKAVSDKLSAWHSLAEPDAENVKRGIGTGQLHRSGRNFVPVSEQDVLEIQRKNKKWVGGKSMFSFFSLNSRKIKTMGETVLRMVQREEHNQVYRLSMETFASHYYS